MWLPRLPTDRLTRGARADKGRSDGPPLIIAGRAGNALVVAALEARAERLGLYRGQPLANARAMVRDLAIVPADAAADARLLDAIADWCGRFSPFVAADPPDGLVLDITGAAHLFGGEAAMLAEATRRLGAQGFAVQAAIAGTRAAARALARFADGHITAPGADAPALARLPVAALDCDPRTVTALTHAGLRTIGQVAARGRSELAARFGQGFVALLETLLDGEDRPIAPRRPLPDLMAEQRFAEPIVSESAIAASLGSLLQSLGGVLEQRGLGARMLEAAFFRADGQVRRMTLRLGAPSRDATAMLRLLREKLDALADPLDPGFGFDLIRVEAMLAERLEPSTPGLAAGAAADREIRFLIDRLAARHGEARMLRFIPQDTHIPEAASAAVPAQDDAPDTAWRIHRLTGDPPLRPLRLFERPEAIKVPFATVPDGPPARFHWRRARFDVARAEGPERIAMQWWRDLGPTRDYFRVETSEGQRFWLYRDGLYDTAGTAPRWFLHGIFA